MLFSKAKADLKIEQLYYQYRNIMYREAYSVLQDAQLAEDAVSESIIRVVHNLHKLDVDDVPRTRAFMVIVTRNVARDIYRARTPLMEEEEVEFQAKTSPSAMDIVMDKASVERIVEVIQNLKPIYKDTLILRKFYDLPCEDIARLTEASIQTVQKRITRAKAQIAEALQREVAENEKRK